MTHADGPEKGERSAETLRPLGPYKLVALLGRGGMGEVHLATREVAGIERVCVVKSIETRYGLRPESRARFLDEARTMLLMSHRNICGVLDAGEADGESYLAMEYIAGRDLARVLSEAQRLGQRPPLRVALAIGVQMLDALDYAHHLRHPKTGEPLGIVHRDISPHNVLLSFDGDVKLIDFGLALSAVRSASTRPGIALGKTRYMAPEQALGEPVDARTDVFAAAVTTYELLFAERFWGDLPIDAIASKMRAPEFLPVRFSSLPSAIAEPLRAALALNPRARTPTCGALRDALVAAMRPSGGLATTDEIRAWLRALMPGVAEGDALRVQRALGGGVGTSAPSPAPADATGSLVSDPPRLTLADRRSLDEVGQTATVDPPPASRPAATLDMRGAAARHGTAGPRMADADDSSATLDATLDGAVAPAIEPAIDAPRLPPTLDLELPRRRPADADARGRRRVAMGALAAALLVGGVVAVVTVSRVPPGTRDPSATPPDAASLLDTHTPGVAAGPKTLAHDGHVDAGPAPSEPLGNPPGEGDARSADATAAVDAGPPTRDLAPSDAGPGRGAGRRARAPAPTVVKPRIEAASKPAPAPAALPPRPRFAAERVRYLTTHCAALPCTADAAARQQRLAELSAEETAAHARALGRCLDTCGAPP